MVKSVSENLSDAGKSFVKTAKNVAASISDEAEKAVGYVKEKAGMETKDVGVTGIRVHMDVIASCGKKIGVVDHLEDSAIKLTRKDSPDGEHHYVPTSWVAKVDTHVHLSKNSQEAEKGWQSTSTACNCS